jgi:hypothetical protein
MVRPAERTTRCVRAAASSCSWLYGAGTLARAVVRFVQLHEIGAQLQCDARGVILRVEAAFAAFGVDAAPRGYDHNTSGMP